MTNHSAMLLSGALYNICVLPKTRIAKLTVICVQQLLVLKTIMPRMCLYHIQIVYMILPVIYTVAPASPSCKAMPLPIPLEAPVTRQMRPARAMFTAIIKV